MSTIDCALYETCRLRIARAWAVCPDTCEDYYPMWAAQEDREEAARANLASQALVDWEREMDTEYGDF